ncbi:hypothetical protein DAPPUDRAFT_267308 [Daphnia pulex]|uniref:Uncharacterized protein n=1 Tax=Daphnia pulex TaxID=6669 RepID=E9HWA8_DAPPU|nr:hypothetical protein DAPPUDRAFT_267308 [Daphnia pulex]|eukprot:EFX63974.1 hypothetical protein DAPPUDRAFT_267308 [Daphnia pulex]
MRCSTTPVVDLVMPSISRMHLVPKGKKKKPFLKDQMMTDIKSLKKERMTPTKSKVQKNKLPRVVLKTESKAAVAAEIAKAIKSKAPTIKKEANWTSPTSSVLTTPAAQPSIKLTIRLKASKIHSSTEYEIVKLKNEDEHLNNQFCRQSGKRLEQLGVSEESQSCTLVERINAGAEQHIGPNTQKVSFNRFMNNTSRMPSTEKAMIIYANQHLSLAV